jgi:uncharacterized protein DUF4235
MRLLYKPFGIIGGIIAGRLGQKAFKSIWAKIDEEPLPKPSTGQGSIGKVVGGRALEAGVMAASAAAVDRAFARGFHYFIGIWPKKPPKPEDEQQD